MQTKQFLNSIFILTSSVLITCLNFSCGKKIVDPIKTVNYIYKNNSGVDLSIEVYNSENLLIKNFDVVNKGEVETNTSSEEIPVLFYFASTKNQQGDSVIVRFVDDKCLHYLKLNKDKIFDITKYDNYSPELITQNKFTLYFSFTEEDYKQAIDCN